MSPSFILYRFINIYLCVSDSHGLLRFALAALRLVSAVSRVRDSHGLLRFTPAVLRFVSAVSRVRDSHGLLRFAPAVLRFVSAVSFAAFALRACCSAVTFVAYMVSCKQACQIPCPLLTVNRSICHLQRIRPEALYPLRIPEKLHHLLRCGSSYLQSLTDLLLLRNHRHR